MHAKKHSGFSLLELIVVVMIVSLIGFLVFSSAIKQQTKTETLNPASLPKTLRKIYQGQGDIELFCINKCLNCYVVQDKQINAYEGDMQLGKDVEVYKLDDSDHLVQIEDVGRVQDKKICLRFHLYPNGSTTQMVITNTEGVYYLPSYFGKATKVADMEEAKELWIKEEYDLSDSGSFY